MQVIHWKGQLSDTYYRYNYFDIFFAQLKCGIKGVRIDNRRDALQIQKSLKLYMRLIIPKQFSSKRNNIKFLSIGVQGLSFYDSVYISIFSNNRPDGRAVTRSSLEREVWGSNLGPVKSDTMLPTARHRCDISSKEAVLPRRNDAETGPANSLHASAYYSEYNERFDLIWFSVIIIKIPNCSVSNLRL